MLLIKRCVLIDLLTRARGNRSRCKVTVWMTVLTRWRLFAAEFELTVCVALQLLGT